MELLESYVMVCYNKNNTHSTLTKTAAVYMKDMTIRMGRIEPATVRNVS